MPPAEPQTFTLSIAAFMDDGPIPAVYTCDGAGESPAVEWSGVPGGTQSLALIMEDPDVPRMLREDGLFVHWVLHDIPPSAAGIPRNWSAGSVGINSAGRAGYYPPCPPAQYEPKKHRYVFTLYALDTLLPPFDAAPDKAALMQAMAGHILAQATYTGRYERP